MRTENITGLLIFDVPGRNGHVLRILWIDQDVIEDVIVAAQAGKSLPVMAAIIGKKDGTCAGTDEHPGCTVRIKPKASDIPTIRPQHRPLCCPGYRQGGDYD